MEIRVSIQKSEGVYYPLINYIGRNTNSNISYSSEYFESLDEVFEIIRTEMVLVDFSIEKVFYEDNTTRNETRVYSIEDIQLLASNNLLER